MESLIISRGTHEKKEKLNYKSNSKSINWEELPIQRVKNFLQQATTLPVEFMTMNFIGLSKSPSSSLLYKDSSFRGPRWLSTDQNKTKNWLCHLRIWPVIVLGRKFTITKNLRAHYLHKFRQCWVNTLMMQIKLFLIVMAAVKIIKKKQLLNSLINSRKISLTWILE